MSSLKVSFIFVYISVTCKLSLSSFPSMTSVLLSTCFRVIACYLPLIPKKKSYSLICSRRCASSFCLYSISSTSDTNFLCSRTAAFLSIAACKSNSCYLKPSPMNLEKSAFNSFRDFSDSYILACISLKVFWSFEELPIAMRLCFVFYSGAIGKITCCYLELLNFDWMFELLLFWTGVIFSRLFSEALD